MFPISFLSFHGIYMRKWMLAQPMVIILQQMELMLFASSFYRGACQLFLKATGKKKTDEEFPPRKQIGS